MKQGQTLLGTGYTHFAVLYVGDKMQILSGWDYKRYDHVELMFDKQHYFFNDLKEWELPTKKIHILRRSKLRLEFIRDSANWYKPQQHEESGGETSKEG